MDEIDDAVVEAAMVAAFGEENLASEEWQHGEVERAREAVCAAIRAAVLAEREACAKVAESSLLPFSLGGDLILDRNTADTIANAIRARGNGGKND